MKEKRWKRFLLRFQIKFAGNDKYIEILRKRGMKIGSGCFVDKTAVVGGEPYLITVGNEVRITRDVKFITHDGGLWVPRRMGLCAPDANRFGRINIGNNVNIGWGAMILPGVTIGDNCVIGCGAVVTKDIPSGSVAVGVPARVIESVEEYVQKNKDRLCNTKNLSDNEKKKYLLEHLDDL